MFQLQLFFLLHCDEWDRVVALPRHKFVTGATLLQLMGYRRWYGPEHISTWFQCCPVFVILMIRSNLGTQSHNIDNKAKWGKHNPHNIEIGPNRENTVS